MIVVRVELHSAITGKVTEIGRAHIINDGSEENPRFGNYKVAAFRGRSRADLDKHNVQRFGRVERYPRTALHVLNLVARGLAAMGYA